MRVNEGGELSIVESPPRTVVNGAKGGIWPRRLDVLGMFNQDSPKSLELRLDERVTILSGPNGSGKTRLLFILKDALQLDWNGLASEPFQRMTLEYTDGHALKVTRSIAQSDVTLLVEVWRASRQLVSAPMTLSIDPAAGLNVPPWIVRISEDLWQDTNDGEVFDQDEVVHRFGYRPQPGEPSRWQLSAPPTEAMAQIQTLVGRFPMPTLVETKRLDT